MFPSAIWTISCCTKNHFKGRYTELLWADLVHALVFCITLCGAVCCGMCLVLYVSNSYQLFCWNGYNKLELEPTWQIEEGVEDIETLCIISLDKLVGVPFTDLWAGKSKKAQKRIKCFIKCLYLWCLLVCRDLCILRGNVENTYPRRKLNPWTQTRILP